MIQDAFMQNRTLFRVSAIRHSVLQSLAILLIGIPIGLADDHSGAVEMVAHTERAFSSRCAEVGIRDAFLEYFSADAIHFEPEPRLARPDLEGEQSTVTPRLTWEPKIIRVASSGELAVSTGPYILDSKTGKQSFGYFLSIWKRQTDGKWKVDIDIGVPTSRSADLPEDFQAYDDSFASESLESSKLLAFEREQFGRTDDLAAIYQSLILPQTVFERAYLPLMTGESSYQSLLAAALQTKHISLSQSGGDLSGNLGFTYGTESDKQSPAVSYLRVWIWRPPGWRLLFDVVTNEE
jgi:hypothetical protein